jgi:hypothetical protein
MMRYNIHGAILVPNLFSEGLLASWLWQRAETGTISFTMSVSLCPPFRMQQLGNRWKEIGWNFILRIFAKMYHRIPVQFKIE